MQTLSMIQFPPKCDGIISMAKENKPIDSPFPGYSGEKVADDVSRSHHLLSLDHITYLTAIIPFICYVKHSVHY